MAKRKLGCMMLMDGGNDTESSAGLQGRHRQLEIEERNGGGFPR